MESVVCLLVVNRITELPELAVESVLKNSNVKIVIGFVDPSDISDLPVDERITYLKLDTGKDSQSSNVSRNYQDFTSDAFYQIVQLKWTLFLKMLDMGYNQIIYTDLDVVWNTDVSRALALTFLSKQKTEILIQSQTTNPENPILCMGLFAFKNTQRVKSFILKSQKLHKQLAVSQPKIGDDDVVSLLYKELDFPVWISELPQTTFPTGNLINLFNPSESFPGLKAPKPYIFHANYVVGNRNKRILLRLFLRFHKSKYFAIQSNKSLWLIYFAKTLKNHFRRIKTHKSIGVEN